MGLLSFLIFAGFFFFMMKMGCGSHVAHGHHEKDRQITNNIVDPVCGKIIGEEEGYGKLQDGHLYRFCSKECLDEFDNEPEKYLKKIS